MPNNRPSFFQESQSAAAVRSNNQSSYIGDCDTQIKLSAAEMARISHELKLLDYEQALLKEFIKFLKKVMTGEVSSNNLPTLMRDIIGKVQEEKIKEFKQEFQDCSESDANCVGLTGAVIKMDDSMRAELSQQFKQQLGNATVIYTSSFHILPAQYQNRLEYFQCRLKEIERRAKELMALYMERGGDKDYQSNMQSSAQRMLMFYDPSPLLLACAIGDMDELQRVIQEIRNGVRFYKNKKVRESLEALNQDGYCSLHIAAINGQTRIIEALLQRGMDINFRCRDQSSVLHISIETENQRLFDFIIQQQGVDLNLRGRMGRTPLNYAVFTGQVDMVRALLDREINPSTRSSAEKDRGRSPLHIAIEQSISPSDTTPEAAQERFECYRAIAELLLERGANKNALDYDNFSPLGSAVWRSNIAMVKWLVEQGVQIDTESLMPMLEGKIKIEIRNNTPPENALATQIKAYLEEKLQEQQNAAGPLPH